jgi:hypothetical protein
MAAHNVPQWRGFGDGEVLLSSAQIIGAMANEAAAYGKTAEAGNDDALMDKPSSRRRSFGPLSTWHICRVGGVAQKIHERCPFGLLCRG